MKSEEQIRAEIERLRKLRSSSATLVSARDRIAVLEWVLSKDEPRQ